MKKILVTQATLPPYEEYIEMIKPLWESHWITNMGSYHQRLEERLKEFLGTEQISLMVNGHMALEMAIQAMGFPKESEIITTPFTFISTTHAIIRNNMKPVFCDIKATDFTIDEGKIEELITEKTVAIIPVHVYGNVCNVEAIQKIADRYGLKVIYDAAHAFGVDKDGEGIGSYGDMSIFSFHATKIFNTIEGGAITFGNQSYVEKLYNLKNFGIKSEELVAEVGANAKMNEFQAAMGLCNLKNLNESVNKRKRIVAQYQQELSKVTGITMKCKQVGVTENYSYFPIIVSEEYGLTRDELYNKLAKHEIYSRKYFYPITSDQACFKRKYSNLSLEVAREISKKVLTLPLYPELMEEDVKRICKIIRVQKEEYE